MKGFFIVVGFLIVASYFVHDMSEVMILWRGDDIYEDTRYFVMLRTSYSTAALALLFFVSLFTPKNLMQVIFGNALKGLPDYVFKTATYMWIAFFLLLAVINYYLMANLDVRGWCIWKLMGFIPLCLLFVISQIIYFSQQAKKNNIVFEATR